MKLLIILGICIAIINRISAMPLITEPEEDGEMKSRPYSLPKGPLYL